MIKVEVLKFSNESEFCQTLEKYFSNYNFFEVVYLSYSKDEINVVVKYVS